MANLGLILQQAANVMRPSPFDNTQPLVPTGITGPLPSGPAPDATPPHGFFRDGGMGRYIAGAIGDMLLQNAGMRPVFSPAQQQREQAAAEDAQWTRRQQSELANQMALKKFELANKPPPSPHFWERNDGSLAALDPETGEVKVIPDPTPKMNFIPDGLGGGQWVAVPSTAPTTLTKPLGPLGPVVNELPGGGAGNGTGGFRYP